MLQHYNTVNVNCIVDDIVTPVILKCNDKVKANSKKVSILLITNICSYE